MRNRKIPVISVIIPFSGQSVDQTLTSLNLCHDKEKCEIILVNDGLNEEDLGFLEAHQRNLNIKVITTDKCGKIGYLRNLGIEQAVSRYLFFVDSDCWVANDVIRRIIAHQNITVLKGRVAFLGRSWISRLDAQLRDERYRSNPTYAYCPNLIISAEVFEQIGYFDSKFHYGSDGEFAKRIYESSMQVRYDDEIVIQHDCTDSFFGIFKKWMNYGEGRYLRLKNSKHKLSDYFPNLYNTRRGVSYNIIVFLCNLGRLTGIIRAWVKAIFPN